MPARAHAGDAHALREVAIGKAHPRAAKAALGGLFEVETRLERHALERRANCLASDPERSRWQRYRACRSRAAELDGPDDRAVTIDAAGAARAIETIKREKLAGYEAPRGVGGEAFRAGRAGCKQDQNHHRQPSNHTGPSPVTPSDRSLLLDELPQRYRHLPASSRQLKATLRDCGGPCSFASYSGRKVTCSMRAVQDRKSVV